MLEVATSDAIVGPMRLLFPRNPGGIGDAADFPYSLLGLGDVALPGVLGLCPCGGARVSSTLCHMCQCLTLVCVCPRCAQVCLLASR
jgi:hypothetical protein